MAAGMGAPLPAVAGAIVAGAYFGDKMSPLSDSTNMSAIATETNLYQHIGHMFYTTVPGFIVSCIVYLVAGAHFASDSQVGQVDEIINTLGKLFNLSMPTGLLLLIPCVIVIAGSLMKKPTIPVMIISSAVAVVIAMAIQGFSFSDCAASMVSGFKMEMLHTSVDLENIVEQIPNLLQRWYEFHDEHRIDGILWFLLHRRTYRMRKYGTDSGTYHETYSWYRPADHTDCCSWRSYDYSNRRSYRKHSL